MTISLYTQFIAIDYLKLHTKYLLTVYKRLSYVTVFASAGMVSTGYLKVTMYSLISFAAGPAWGVS